MLCRQQMIKVDLYGSNDRLRDEDFANLPVFAKLKLSSDVAQAGSYQVVSAPTFALSWYVGRSRGSGAVQNNRVL